MNWLSDTSLRNLDEAQILEATCLRCLHIWVQSSTALLLKTNHRDVYLDEVAENLSCQHPGCRHVGVRLVLLRADETSGFVGGCRRFKTHLVGIKPHTPLRKMQYSCLSLHP